jgi:hypothetical protein
LNRGIGEHDRTLVDSVEVGPVVGLGEPGIGGLEAVPRCGFEVEPRTPLIAIVLVALQEPVPRRVDAPVFGRVAHVEVVRVRCSGHFRQKVATDRIGRKPKAPERSPRAPPSLPT